MTAITPAGFQRDGLTKILSDLEAKNREVFGADIIQSSQSPFGQFNGIRSEALAKFEEVAEATYASFDVDQAEGVRLDILAKLRGLLRVPGESDADFGLAITNIGRARIDTADVERAIKNITGVTFARFYPGDADIVTTATGVEAGHVALAVLGGDDVEIATVLRNYVAPGIVPTGNLRVETTIGGYCRSVFILRPALVPIYVRVKVIRRADALGCPPPALAAIEEGLISDLSAYRLANGEDVTAYVIRSVIEAKYPNVEVTEVLASRSAIVGGEPMPLAIAFDEIASFSAARTEVLNA